LESSQKTEARKGYRRSSRYAEDFVMSQTSIYLSAAYGRFHDMRKACKKLEESGKFRVVSTWHNEIEPNGTPGSKETWQDLQDLNNAELIVLFLFENIWARSKGGKAFEAGFASAKGKPIVTIEEGEIVHFIKTLRVGHYDTLEEFIQQWRI